MTDRIARHNAHGDLGQPLETVTCKQAVKIFKQPSHPDYQGLPLEQQAAKERIKEHQIKLKQFPSLPRKAIAPQELVTDKTGKTILGYTMPLLNNALPLFKYSDRHFRSSSGISNQTIVQIFQDLHQTISQIHNYSVILGDFNDLNVLITGNQAYLIDTDSFQYGQFLCRVYTTRFVDPLLCDSSQNQPILSSPHNLNSDWYAFTVMLMQCLLFVEPYGGVYKPKNKANIPHLARPLKRITVFHPEVIYPKPALPYTILTDDLLQQFHSCFVQDKRGEFPRQLLDNLHWQKCPDCGLDYLRHSCPKCAAQTVQIAKPQPTNVAIHSTVSITEIFQTKGIILTACFSEKQLHWLSWEKGEFKREDETVIFTGDLDPYMRFWLYGKSTLIGKAGQVITINSEQPLERIATDNYQNLPMLNCNQSARYWLYQGQLLRDGQLGQQYIGDVLQGQTQFWVGNQFGFGFYCAGNIKVAFVFDAKNRGINDRVKLPQWGGKIIDTDCTFSSNLCWFFLATQEQNTTINHLYLIQSDGTIIATTESLAGENNWLTSIHGHCAVNNFLLVATDEGIVRLEAHNGQILKIREFPDTEPFVDHSCYLYPSAQGLYVVTQQKITLLQIQ